MGGSMTDYTSPERGQLQAACRAALLKACKMVYVRSESKPGPYVNVDDAAACLADREAKLREALRRLLEVIDRNGPIKGVPLADWLDSATPDEVVTEARAALAAA